MLLVQNALALVLALAPLAAAQKPAPPVDPAQAAERLRLEREYQEADRAFRAALADAQHDQQAGRQLDVGWMRKIVTTYYSRFEELAWQDVPLASTWCLDQIAQCGFAPAEIVSRKDEIYGKLVTVHADWPYVTDVARRLQGESGALGIGAERALAHLATLASSTHSPDARAAALWYRSMLCATRVDETSKAAARAALETLAKELPTTDFGRRASGRLFQIEHLQIGKTPPDFTTRDVDGVEFKLSDYRGKVVVLDFWGFW